MVTNWRVYLISPTRNFLHFLNIISTYTYYFARRTRRRERDRPRDRLLVGLLRSHRRLVDQDRIVSCSS